MFMNADSPFRNVVRPPDKLPDTVHRERTHAFPSMPPEYVVRNGRIALEVRPGSAESQLMGRALLIVSYSVHDQLSALEAQLATADEDDAPRMRIMLQSYRAHLRISEDLRAELRGRLPYDRESMGRSAPRPEAPSSLRRGLKAAREVMRLGARGDDSEETHPEPNVDPVRFVDDDIDFILGELGAASDLMAGVHAVEGEQTPEQATLQNLYVELGGGESGHQALNTLLTTLVQQRPSNASAVLQD